MPSSHSNSFRVGSGSPRLSAAVGWNTKPAIPPRASSLVVLQRQHQLAVSTKGLGSPLKTQANSLSPSPRKPWMRDDGASTVDSTSTSVKRWSRVVPPDSALTFGAIWDPIDGMVTFSIPKLQIHDASPTQTADSVDSPLDANSNDGRSQVLTIDRLTALNQKPGEKIVNTAALALSEVEDERPIGFACEALFDVNTYMDSFFPAALYHSDGRRDSSASTEGIERYVRTSLLPKLPAESRADHQFDWSCLNEMDKKLLYHPRDAFVEACRANGASSSALEKTSTATPVEDEGFYEVRRMASQSTGKTTSDIVFAEPIISSSFSTTTTSTSNYVDVSDVPASDTDTSSLASSSWSTVQAPSPSEYLSNSPSRSRRRCLKKARHYPQSQPRTRTPEAPANPADVLARTHYNHVSPHHLPSPDLPSTTPIERKAACLRHTFDSIRSKRRCRSEDDEQWVGVDVEVTYKVTQHIL